MEEFWGKNRLIFIDWLNSQWNIRFKIERPDINIEGSPERTLSRMAIQDISGDLFLIEKFSKDKFSIRQTVALAVHYLNLQGLDSALAYEKTTTDEFLPFFEQHCYGLTSFLHSTALQRPDYLSSKKMGDSFASFLIQMNSASVQIDSEVSLATFSIKDYIYKIFIEMKQYDPGAYNKFSPFLVFLEDQFMDAHDQLPLGFCHGDLHPLNVIWDNDQIRAVIDWEFIGIKPQIYDAANLVGCAGIENPNGLAMPMVTTFLQRLQKQKIFDRAGWKFFVEYILALRFAWLSEWLRKKDDEMIEMEAAFMKILVDNKDALKQGWGIDNL